MEVELAELSALHDFPSCPSGSDLPRFLGEWFALVQEHGRDLPQRHLTTLLTNMLPREVHDDVKRMNMLHSQQEHVLGLT